MGVLELLHDAQQHGIEIVVEGDRLIVSGPAVAEPVAHRIGAHKTEIIAALSACTWCGGRPSDGGFDAIGDPWCAHCRDAELNAQRRPPAVLEAQELRAAWTGALFEIGELAGFPALPYKPGHSVSFGPIAYRQFGRRASAADVHLAIDRLRQLLDGPTELEAEQTGLVSHLLEEATHLGASAASDGEEGVES